MKCNFIRLSALVMCLVLCLSLALPAFAEEINYRDYETRVDVDGDNDLVTVSIPVDWCEGQIVYGGGTELREWSGSSVSWDFTDSVLSYDKLRVYIAPFGTAYGSWDYDYGNGRYLSTSNIPSGTTFNIDFAIKLESTNNDISYPCLFKS